MVRRTQTRSSNRARQKRTPIAANRESASVRRPSKPPLVEPFYIAPAVRAARNALARRRADIAEVTH